MHWCSFFVYCSASFSFSSSSRRWWWNLLAVGLLILAWKKGRDRLQKGQSIVTSTRLAPCPNRPMYTVQYSVPNGPAHSQMRCGVLKLYFCRRGHVIQKRSQERVWTVKKGWVECRRPFCFPLNTRSIALSFHPRRHKQRKERDESEEEDLLRRIFRIANEMQSIKASHQHFPALHSIAAAVVMRRIGRKE